MKPQIRNFIFIAAGISFAVALLIANSLLSFPSSPLTASIIRHADTSSLVANPGDDQLRRPTGRLRAADRRHP